MEKRQTGLPKYRGILSDLNIQQHQENLGMNRIGDTHRYDADSVVRKNFSSGGQVLIDDSLVDYSSPLSESACIEIVANMTVLLSEIYNIPVCYVVEAIENHVVEEC